MDTKAVKGQCPICTEYNGETPLDTHLLTHSKESLVTTLLHLNHNSGPGCSAEESVGTSSDPDIPINIKCMEERIEDDVEALNDGPQFFSEEVVESVNPSSCSVTQETETEDQVIVNVTESEKKYPTPDVIVNVNPTSDIEKVEAGHSRTKKPCEKPMEVLIVSTSRVEGSQRFDSEAQNGDDRNENTYTILQTMAVNADDCRRVDEITIAEFGDAENMKTWSVTQVYPDDCNLSTAIKYIIDETDNRNSSGMNKEEQLIFLDGRYIPVYSSLSELNCSSPHADSEEEARKEVAAQAICHEEVSPDSDNSNLDVDLMTDEEIPPQGEISEFEESSASMMSDDSNLRPVGFESSVKSISSAGTFSTRQISMSLVNSAEESARKVNVKGSIFPSSSGGGSTSKAEEFICFDECQNHKSPKQFSSLFEMIQHKSGTLPTRLKKTLGTECAAATSNTKELQTNEDMPLSSLDSSGVESERMPEPVPLISVLQRKNYFCLYCDFTSPSKILLNSHCKEEHPDRNMNPDQFECSTCGKIFGNRASLRKHLLIHKQKLFVCSVCSKGFPSKYKLMEHNRIHTGNYPYKCKHCGKAYRTPSLLSTHEKRIHPATEPERLVPRKVELMCGICHRIMHSKRNLQSHLQLHKQKPQKCPHCSETFPRPSVLVRHIRASHDPLYTSVKTKDCNICGKFYHPNSMKAHMLIHKKEKPHRCPVCHKNFRTLGNLNNHSWSHTSAERPYKCQSCPKSYIFLKNLQNHAIVHKRKTLHFVCNECGVKFTNKCNLKRHVEEHTSEKKFKCLICGKKFFRHYYLVEHVRIHSGSRPYTCTICGKASSTKSNHVAHVKIHDARESGNLEG